MQPAFQKSAISGVGVIRMETSSGANGVVKEFNHALVRIVARPVMLAGLLLLFLSSGGRAASDSLLCGFLVGLGATEKTIGTMLEHLSSSDARDMAHRESRMLDLTFVRFHRWYPDIAAEVEPFVRSRQAVFHSYITGGSTTAVSRYFDGEAVTALEGLERTLSSHECSVPFNRVELMAQMRRHATVVKEDRSGDVFRHFRGGVPLAGVSIACIGGLLVAFLHEARSRLRQIRFLVSIDARLITPTEVHSCSIRDVSRRGAKIFFKEGHCLTNGQQATLFACNNMVLARVQWGSSNHVGLQFRRALSKQLLSDLLSESRTTRRVRRQRFPKAR